ncbi:hypothetical protein ACH518_03140 [Methylomonas sp. HW2-6]|uniref:hypothetical protein n=1 Tax=Methylomonas sp. HW2-6 TaxID=3376687 RepID=UPI00404317F1
MSVLIEAISVVVRAEDLLKKFPGGWDAFKSIIPNRTLCADNEVVRVGFMTPQDVESFIKKLQRAGLEFLRDGEAIDVAVVDQIHGISSKCAWLEFGHVSMDGSGPRIAACRLVGSRINQVITPPDWKYEGSLSSTFGFVPSDHVAKGMKYLRHENGLDVYLNPTTGQEIYVGRTCGS